MPKPKKEKTSNNMMQDMISFSEKTIEINITVITEIYNKLARRKNQLINKIALHFRKLESFSSLHWILLQLVVCLGEEASRVDKYHGKHDNYNHGSIQDV